ncbi:hypothetical protein [Halovenus marina]|uniref:hypothetical protein n=1 Tax=Halovenus marina TaxID=3396621 RepID=UPI003F57DC21
MDAFLHADCGLDNMTRAQYTQQELARLQLGYLRREYPEQLAGGDGGSADKQRRKIRRGQEQSRQEMLDDLGFE